MKKINFGRLVQLVVVYGVGLLISLMVLMSAGCGGGGGGGGDTSETTDEAYPPWDVPYAPASDAIADQNDFVYRLMRDVYLWYDKVPEGIDPAAFDSPEQLLDAIKYKTLDRWSFIELKSVVDAYYGEGQYYGLGIKLGYDQDNNVRIALVYPDSPADIHGLVRGDKILEINGQEVDDIDDVENNLQNINIIKIQKIDNTINSIVISNDYFTIPSVYTKKILTNNGKKIGYLMFLGFIEPAQNDLQNAFAYFQNEGIDELIVDLRYNGGGLVKIAKELGSLISGRGDDDIFYKYRYNNKYQLYNSPVRFTTYAESLHLNRIIFLTTEQTASASELVINGLKPYMDVITIGSTTHGKPVGMCRYEFADKVIYPITFSLVNVNDEGDYYDGISPVCSAEDELTVALGNATEDMLETALFYIQNGTCPPQTEALARAVSVEHKRVELKGFRQVVGAF